MASNASPSLDDELDAGNNNVPKHIGVIANSISEWEGPLAEALELTDPEVEEIKTKHPGKLGLQS